MVRLPILSAVISFLNYFAVRYPESHILLSSFFPQAFKFTVTHSSKKSFVQIRDLIHNIPDQYLKELVMQSPTKDTDFLAVSPLVQSGILEFSMRIYPV